MSVSRSGVFSIVTPNYNTGHLLPETIESVLTNLQSGDEYFIIDGGSTDNSVDVIRRYESHLTGWLSEPDGGYAEALVKGFRRCTGEFLGWINAGDLLLKGALPVARQVLTETGADLIFGDDVYIDEQSRVIFHSHGHARSLKHMMLYGGWTPLQDACYWRRSLYERLGGINPTLKYAADYDFFLRASLTGRCVYAQKVFSAFRRHENQKSISASVHYKTEREKCRRQMLTRFVPVQKRLLLEPFYWFAVRWRFHVARHFFQSTIPTGTVATTLVVQ